MAINEIPLLDRETILRRIAHMKGEPFVNRPTEITVLDMAKWFGVKRERIDLHTRKKEPISDTWQLCYSHFFHLVDTGQLALNVVVDPNDGRKKRKELIRVPKPEVLPKRPIRPHIDFAEGMSLKFV